MPRVLITAKVKDAEAWKQGFVGNVDLFKRQSATSPVHYSVNEHNEIAITAHIDNLSVFSESLQGPDAAAAMEKDGVIKDSLRLTVFDSVLHLD